MRCGEPVIYYGTFTDVWWITRHQERLLDAYWFHFLIAVFRIDFRTATTFDPLSLVSQLAGTLRDRELALTLLSYSMCFLRFQLLLVIRFDWNFPISKLIGTCPSVKQPLFYGFILGFRCVWEQLQQLTLTGLSDAILCVFCVVYFCYAKDCPA